MGRMCDVMCECVHDYSSTKVNTPFALVAARDNAIIKDAKNLYAPLNFVLLNNNTVQYKDNFGQLKYYISFRPRFCSCQWFLELAICRHYVAACFLLGHVDENDSQFVIVKRKDRPKGAK